jgi:hypothetical protein
MSVVTSRQFVSRIGAFSILETTLTTHNYDSGRFSVPQLLVADPALATATPRVEWACPDLMDA